MIPGGLACDQIVCIILKVLRVCACPGFPGLAAVVLVANALGDKRVAGIVSDAGQALYIVL
jgi:hypothetical protein